MKEFTKHLRLRVDELGMSLAEAARRRELSERRPEDSRSWLRLAEMLNRHEYRPEAGPVRLARIALRPCCFAAHHFGEDHGIAPWHPSRIVRQDRERTP